LFVIKSGRQKLRDSTGCGSEHTEGVPQFCLEVHRGHGLNLCPYIVAMPMHVHEQHADASGPLHLITLVVLLQ
jgi:hypothetical protein